jgi:hypothetical protein
MTTFEITLIGLVAVIFLSQAWMIAEYTGMKNELREKAGINNEALKIRLQAYERLTLLAERIALPNLISRIPNAGISAKEMQGALIEAIKSEYDYNLSQRVYVTTEAWRAVNNLKEQNIYIINQLATTLPPQATAMDLNKRIIDYLMSDEKASLHNIVLEALSYETKQLF